MLRNDVRYKVFSTATFDSLMLPWCHKGVVSSSRLNRTAELCGKSPAHSDWPVRAILLGSSAGTPHKASLTRWRSARQISCELAGAATTRQHNADISKTLLDREVWKPQFKSIGIIIRCSHFRYDLVGERPASGKPSPQRFDETLVAFAALDLSRGLRGVGQGRRARQPEAHKQCDRLV